MNKELMREMLLKEMQPKADYLAVKDFAMTLYAYSGQDWETCVEKAISHAEYLRDLGLIELEEE